jgi:hypothetical protein
MPASCLVSATVSSRAVPAPSTFPQRWPRRDWLCRSLDSQPEPLSVPRRGPRHWARRAGLLADEARQTPRSLRSPQHHFKTPRHAQPRRRVVVHRLPKQERAALSYRIDYSSSQHQGLRLPGTWPKPVSEGEARGAALPSGIEPTRVCEYIWVLVRRFDGAHDGVATSHVLAQQCDRLPGDPAARPKWRICVRRPREARLPSPTQGRWLRRGSLEGGEGYSRSGRRWRRSLGLGSQFEQRSVRGRRVRAC